MESIEECQLSVRTPCWFCRNCFYSCLASEWCLRVLALQGRSKMVRALFAFSVIFLVVNSSILSLTWAMFECIRVRKYHCRRSGWYRGDSKVESSVLVLNFRGWSARCCGVHIHLTRHGGWCQVWCMQSKRPPRCLLDLATSKEKKLALCLIA